MKLIKSFCVMVLVGLTFFSCSRPKPICIRTIQHAEYIYHNRTDGSVKMMIKDTNGYYEKETHYTILPQDSLRIAVSGEIIAVPFERNNIVKLIFVNENKCVTYNKSENVTFPYFGDGVFDLGMYRDFNEKEIYENTEYKLHYDIDEKDYAKATECQ